MFGLPFRKTAARTVLVFFVAYLCALLLWIPVKRGYGYVTTVIASKLVAGLKETRLEELKEEKDMVQATFTPLRGDSGMLVDIPVPISAYTFNVPLTIGIMAAVYPFIRRRTRAYAEALAMLFSVHLLFVFSLEAKQLTEVFMESGIVSQSTPSLMFYQFLWGFTDNMVIRFEPFLLGFYILLRFGKTSLIPQETSKG